MKAFTGKSLKELILFYISLLTIPVCFSPAGFHCHDTRTWRKPGCYHAQAASLACLTVAEKRRALFVHFYERSMFFVFAIHADCDRVNYASFYNSRSCCS